MYDLAQGRWLQKIRKYWRVSQVMRSQIPRKLASCKGTPPWRKGRGRVKGDFLCNERYQKDRTLSAGPR